MYPVPKSLLLAAIAIALAAFLFGAFFDRPPPDEVARFEQLLSSPEDPPRRFDRQDFVSLTRTVCFGTCPAYTVKIYGSGLVEFLGELYVCVEGPVLTRIPPASAQRLLNALVASGFTALPDFKRRDITDFPSATVVLSQGMDSHRVEHYRGMRSVPRVVSAMERAIDDQANTYQWLPSDGDDGLWCRGPDGARRALPQTEPGWDDLLRD